MSKKQKKFLIIIPVCAFIFSLLLWFIHKPVVRKTFLFQSFDSGRICLEERKFPLVSKDKQLKLFVEELLLGPQNPRYRSVFPHGTTTFFCFFKNKTLFINFSGDIIKSDSSSSDINLGFVLFRKNILHNFKYIKNIKMFADGHEIPETIFVNG